MKKILLYNYRLLRGARSILYIYLIEDQICYDTLALQGLW